MINRVHQLLFSILAITIVLGCKSASKSEQSASYRQGDEFDVRVGDEKWSAFVKGGWFSFIYQPPNSDISIGIDRSFDETSTSKSSDSAIIRSRINLIRRFDDATVTARFRGNIKTVFGNFECFDVTSADPDWQLRSLIGYRDVREKTVLIAFFSPSPNIPLPVIRRYLIDMLNWSIVEPRAIGPD